MGGGGAKACDLKFEAWCEPFRQRDSPRSIHPAPVLSEGQAEVVGGAGKGEEARRGWYNYCLERVLAGCF
jgi:hypothetical protein